MITPLMNVLPTLPLGHPARRYERVHNARFFTVCDYFLSLDVLPGFTDKYEFFRAFNMNSSSIDKTQIEQEVAWRSLCTEFDALYIIGKRLRLEVLGFEQRSPRRSSAKDQTCDFSAKKSGTMLYFEVKDKLSEVRNSELDEDDPDIRHFQPDMVRDIESWLLGIDRLNTKGRPMIPMVDMARRKGADYLMAMVPGWEPLETLVAECFKPNCRVSQDPQLCFVSSDPRLSGLCGVILLREDGSFSVINSAGQGVI
jgi:hypothetical protein